MMTKRTILFSTFILITINTFSQKYMEKIAEKSCECVNKIAKDADPKEIETSLGLCMIEAAGPYQKKLKKDFGIDFTSESGFEELGTQIAVKMAGTCPSILTKMVELVGDDDEPETKTEEVALNLEEVTGVVTKVEKGQFVVFSIKGDNSRQDKFYWLSFAKSNIDLMSNYATLDKKRVKVSYKTEEFFDVRINDYRNIKVITEINVEE